MKLSYTLDSQLDDLHPVSASPEKIYGAPTYFNRLTIYELLTTSFCCSEFAPKPQDMSPPTYILTNNIFIFHTTSDTAPYASPSKILATTEDLSEF